MIFREELNDKQTNIVGGCAETNLFAKKLSAGKKIPERKTRVCPMVAQGLVLSIQGQGGRF